MPDIDELVHYGTPRHSGRYPWGSGQDPQTQRHRDFLSYVKEMEGKGLSQVEIAKAMDLTTTQLRARRSIASNAEKKADTARAIQLKAKGMSNSAIAREMGINESSVRGLLKPSQTEKQDILTNTADMLRAEVAKGGYLDVGIGTESHLGISSTKLSTAVALLREEGYSYHKVQVDQLGTGNKTTIKVLAPPGTSYVDIVRNKSAIRPIGTYSEDGGRTFPKIEPPANISSKRLKVVYADQGGGKADGVIYIRPGVADLSLGSAHYAQVRIAVDGTHYLKGMAVYKDNMPKGTDLEFHTNKHSTGNDLDALKAQKDEANPFGATVRQRHYTDASGAKKLSPLNIVNEEGNWRDWSRTLSSQLLSKQPVALAQRQLDLSLKSRKDELDEINRLTNPVVKQKLLDKFADSAEAASVHLKAAALPGQANHVILPIPSLKPGEIYAPNYENGTRVALVRFPHGGTFEIPEVVVNNKHAEAKATIGSHAPDAIGIHPSVAARLSGADFDGDAVIVIPNNAKHIKTSAPLAGLKDFDPQQSYAGHEGMTKISPRAKQQQMGDVSNLITDMTIKGAKPEEIARAVRHSMVIIDAEKHGLDYKKSYADNGIAALKEKYQGRGATGRLSGSATIISRSGNAQVRVPEQVLRKASQGGAIDPSTGQRVYVKTNATYVDPVTGKIKQKLSVSKPLLETLDAHTLSSGMPIEEVYAKHSNALKAMSGAARKASLHTGNLKYSPTANKVHAAEVSSLNAKLTTALKNKPLERQAQLIAGTNLKARIAANPHLDNADIKKIKGQELDAAREKVGAKKEKVQITDAEWTAIQAGAISHNKLSQILDNADTDQVRKLATPRAATVMTDSKLALAKARLASGFTQAEVAKSLGLPVSTLNSALLR